MPTLVPGGSVYAPEYKKYFKADVKVATIPFWMALKLTSTANRYETGFGGRAQYGYTNG